MGEPATIVADGEDTNGTDGPDVIVGSAGDDIIDPHGGRDLVCALGGWDQVTDNDAERDRILLGAGPDYFRSGPDAIARVEGGLPHTATHLAYGDLIDYADKTGVTADLSARTDSHGNGLYGMESASGTPGRDDITGTSARNELYGSGGPDVMRGLGGDDDLELRGRSGDSPGEALLIGGPGHDRLSMSRRGRAVMLGGPGDDSIDGGNSADRLNGGRGDDHLSGDGGADRVRGGSGADQLYAGWGGDTMAGGPGHDVWRNWDSQHGTDGERVTTVRIDAGTVRDRVGDLVFHDTLVGIEAYRGSLDVEHVYGSARRDRVHTGGTEGSLVDLIYGRRGNDRLTAPRHGWIDGGEGHDRCRAGAVIHCEA